VSNTHGRVGGGSGAVTWTRAISLLAVVGCVSPKAGQPVTADAAVTGDGPAGADTGASEVPTASIPTGTIGAPCRADGACNAGLTCTGARGFPPGAGDRYCAPPCAAIDDCQAFAATSYSIQVPEHYTLAGGAPNLNTWQSKFLSRGLVCAPLGDGPGPKYCQFGCPNLMAVGPRDGGGQACYCIPGYSLNADMASCTFGTSHQCSIFSYGTDEQRRNLLERYGIQTQSPTCTACNGDTRFTDMVGCHSNQYFCEIRTSSLNGDCSELISSDQVQQCLRQRTDFSCTCQSACTASCTDALTCYGCCSCSSVPTVPKPVCNGDAGVPTDAQVPAGNSDSAVVSRTDGAPAVPPDAAPAGDSGGSCVSFSTAAGGVPSIAAAGSAPAAVGGVLADGLYRTTTVRVYGTAYPPDTTTGAFGGVFRLAAPIIEMSYAGSAVAAFAGKGTFSATGTAISITFACSSGGPPPTSISYSVTSPTTVDIITPGPGYVSVATYTRM
jgi:hypothetical protein